MRLHLALLALLLMVISACGPTAAPTVPAVTATIAGAALPETYTSQDMFGGTLTVNYPSGWATKGELTGSSVQLGTSEELLQGVPLTLQPGQLLMVVNALPNSQAAAAVAAGQTLTPKLFLESFLTQLKQSSPTLEVSAVAETTLGENGAARVTGSSPEGDALLMTIASSEAYLLIFATTAKGDLAQQEALILSIAASADYVKAAE